MNSLYARLSKQYKTYRDNGTSPLAAIVTIFWGALAWCLFPLESPNWQKIRANRLNWYPQIAPNKPRIGDILRYIIQSIWLILIVNENSPQKNHRVTHWKQKVLKAYYAWINTLPAYLKQSKIGQKTSNHFQQISKQAYILFLILIIGCAVLLLAICITQPFTPISQFIFLILLLFVALSIRHLPGQPVIILLAVLSFIVSCRYMWWRYTTTLFWEDPLSIFFGMLLVLAETYIFVILVLGFFQTIWPLHRNPVEMPQDCSSWPTIDIMIPTYNEKLSVLKPGVYAALGLDYPKEKMNIYILDDGNRPEFKKFADTVGIHYIARSSNEHAKAGNINNALKYTQGELIVIFDCDHIATRPFLQLTVGWFIKDPKLGILQTPHHFYSADPFERNLSTFKNIPNESSLFYGVVQDGNDFWDATYFCGSGGILRRSALEKIGGFATQSVTEDALTSICLQRLGYTSAYIRIPLSAGLATDSLAAHIGQRIRWARGMVQILRVNNPLRGKGLRLPQRLCYFNAILHFLSGIPRLIFLVTPVAFLLFHTRIIYASSLMVILYAFPHIFHAAIANTRIQGKYRHFLWNEIYETVMAWYIALPTTVALINPRRGKFNVTAKGGLITKNYADWRTARPYLVMILINVAGFIAGISRLFLGPSDEIMAVLITLSWVIYNIAILGGALGVDIETRQVRQSHRVTFQTPAAVARADGYLFPCTLENYSDSGVGIKINHPNLLKNGDKISLLLKNGLEEFQFPCQVIRMYGCDVGIRFNKLSVQQNINLVQCTFSRADTWAIWAQSFAQDKPLESMRQVFTLDFQSYLRIISYSPLLIRKILMTVTVMFMWAASFIPHRIKNHGTLETKLGNN